MMRKKQNKLPLYHTIKRKMDIKIGDIVRVTAGDDKNKVGKILAVNRYTGKVCVEGVKIMQHYVKQNPNDAKSAKTVVKKEGFIDFSNVKKEVINNV